ncbi:MAG: DNA-protecting protein DprA, partial [Candidatus Micrarchaeia archaeon]
ESIPNANVQKDPLLDHLSTPKTFDELLLLTGLGYSELSVKLSNLEMQGKVARQGNFYMAL